ncbi:PCC domain-containing protein [Streptomyces alanosinicus]|uniref:PCC domain-containing protein n=1 Tax=Streptomyces alanosinicus TaxID=68171 RepID=UPI00227D90FA|nr:DUF296 domain-containing protein [Streptomyces alanosinicus]
MTVGRSFGVTFDHEEDFFEALSSFCREHGVGQGYIPTFIGAFAEAEIVGACEKLGGPDAGSRGGRRDHDATRRRSPARLSRRMDGNWSTRQLRGAGKRHSPILTACPPSSRPASVTTPRRYAHSGRTSPRTFADSSHNTSGARYRPGPAQGADSPAASPQYSVGPPDLSSSKRSTAWTPLGSPTATGAKR